MSEYIELKNVRVNNLKNISLKIPRDRLVVIAGVSGSGKSSLAFDTLYAEGQRRYVESLSAYARQFLGRMHKPECDYIKGLPPAIAIDQKVNTRNPRSTVGTTTEIYEYLKILFAKIGKTYSPISGQEVKKHHIEDVIHQVSSFSKGTKFYVSAPLHIPEGRTLTKHLEMLHKVGYVRILEHNNMTDLSDAIKRLQMSEESISSDPQDYKILVDRLIVDESKEFISRLTDSVETAMYEGDGECILTFLPSNICYQFSTKFEADGIKFSEPSENMFSYNSPLGACSRCEGFGRVIGIDENLVIPQTSLSVYDGCVQCWHGDKMGEWKLEFCRRATADNFPIFKPYYQLTRQEKDMLWHGLPSENHLEESQKVCIDSFFRMVQENQYKIQYRVMLSRYRGKTICPDCHGTRLKREATWVKIGGMSITELIEMPISQLKKWFSQLQLSEWEQQIAKRILTEITNRLDFMLDVGLGYLTLNRSSNTLSGGESQRIRLTTSLGSSLIGSLYILDEPSIGLHSRDTQRLIKVLKQLVDLNNTVIIVEHDEEIIRSADHLIDIGPDAGQYGGEIVYQGKIKTGNKTTTDVPNNSHTIAYLNHQETIELPPKRRKQTKAIKLLGARMHNLKGIDVTFPLNNLIAVTGVSGSGKSSLIKGILYPALKRLMGEVADHPGEYTAMEGDINQIKHIEMVDQNPIGKSSRSNPATYIKAYDGIRMLFADQALAKQMGFTPQHFSFNTEGGRCEECKGTGETTVEMQFMADITMPCESCKGLRFKDDILEVKFKDKNINDILNMSITEAIDFLTLHRQDHIVKRLKPLIDVGLGYVKLGQSSSTLSGGESQRVKLAYFIGQEKTKPTLFIFDEPTTGLHFHDIKKLLQSMNALISRGHTVIVVEHNMEVIKSADYVIDLGPDGGDKGGQLVACGTPEEITKTPESITGAFLKNYLK